VRLKPDVILVSANRLAAALKVEITDIPMVGASLRGYST
jgi:hypothetical protein